MKMLRVFPVFVLGLICWPRVYSDDYLPPQLPLVPGGDHSREDHSGLDHQNVNVPAINLSYSNLSNTNFSGANLGAANLQGANVENTNFQEAVLNHTRWLDVTGVETADFTGATFKWADLSGSDLGSANLAGNDMSNADLSNTELGQVNFTGASLGAVNLQGANVENTNFQEAVLNHTRWLDVTGVETADFTGATFKWADLSGSDLGSANLAGNDMSNADLSNTELGQVNFTGASLGAVNLQGANVENTNFQNAILDHSRWLGVTGAQTADFRGATFKWANLSNTDFGSVDFRGVDFSSSNLTNADFNSAILTGANLGSATVISTIFSYADMRRAKGLGGGANTDNAILPDGAIHGLDITAGNRLLVRDFDLAVTVTDDFAIREDGVLEVSLAGAQWGSNMIVQDTTPQLDGALWVNLAAGVDPLQLMGMTFDLFDWTAQLNPDSGFATIEFHAGTLWDIDRLYSTGEVTLTDVGAPGDLNVDGVLDEQDISRLSTAVRDGRNMSYDLNGDGVLDQEDHRVWVKELKETWFGDTDLNGQFNSSDLVQVFVAGKYEIGQEALWPEGDWNGDGVFDSKDMVTAFTDGGYELGLRTEALTVPEPASAILLLGALIVIATRRRHFVP